MEGTGSIRRIFFIAGLFAIFKYLRRFLPGERRKLCGRHRSLIRRIGSVLLMQSPPRFYLGARIQHYNDGIGDVCSHDCFLEEDPGCVRSYCGSCHQSQLISCFHHSHLRCSTPIKEDEKKKILDLEQEVQTLRLMVHELWMCRQAAVSYDSEETLVAVGCIISSTSVPPDQLPPTPPQLPPSPPPPPPPPLPPLPLSLTPVRIVCKKSKATHMCPESKGQTVLSLGEILKDISKVKLRPVERSPGGNPIRRPITPTSPSNVLAAVLRKRFAAIQSVTLTPDYRHTINNSRNSQSGMDMIETCKPSVVVQLFE